MGLYVQYGCGMYAPESWVNFDTSLTPHIERLPFIGRIYHRKARRFPTNVRYGDIIKGLPIKPGTASGVYASHVLEHMALTEMRVALRNTRTMLKPGGVFRLVVPDLHYLAQSYLTHGSHWFMRESGLGHENRPGFRSLISRSSHLWMWDETSMTEALKEAGFVNVRRAAYNDHADQMFCEVEKHWRFANCLAMQAHAP